ncbi:MAG TPA: bifunctional YncE family protein/alkaline phosphatase family protein [Gemmatimonadaceae bacterium]|nr:bifunctional YncE family protein/alkaline phosphatase family protein [Gemmatimonadaceae bacterium]
MSSRRVLALVLAVAAVLDVAPLPAQAVARPKRRAPAPKETPREEEKTSLAEPDEPGDMETLTRQLWEQGRKRLSYEAAVRYAERAQHLGRATRSDEVQLPNGWALAPAGTQTPVGRLPYEAVPYAGKLVVLNSGYYLHEPQTLSVVEPRTGRVARTVSLGALYPSAAVGGDGALYVSGGFDQTVYRLDSTFAATRNYSVAGYAAGVAPVGRDRLAVAYLVAPDSTGPSGAGKVALLNTATGAVEREVAAGYFPSAVESVGERVYVVLSGENRVRVYDRTLALLKTLDVGRGPRALCRDGGRLYVVNSGSDDLSIVDLARDTVVGTLPVRFRGARFGAAPTSCAAAFGRLFVTEAGTNAIAVFDSGAVAPAGLIPTGWYPTRVLAVGDTLYAVSAKGIRPRRPNPRAAREPGASPPGYVLTQLEGALGAVSRADIARNLAAWTSRVEHGSPLYSPAAGLALPIKHVFYVVRENRSYDQVMGDLGRGDGDPTLTLFGRDVTPAGHALARSFVTLDNFYANGEISVLGHSYTTSGYASPFLNWLGNAAYADRYRGYPFGTVPALFSPAYLWDALDDRGVSYRIYGEPYYAFTAAYRILAGSYGEQHPLTRAFYARTMKLANARDRGAAFHTLLAPYEGRARTSVDALRLLGDSTFRAALSAFFTGDASLARALGDDPALRARFAEYLSHYSFKYPTWDLRYSDLQRVADWKADFDAQLAAGAPAAFSYLWLPNDHTAGTDTSYQNPRALVAQNDAALGRLVETISRSPIWKESLILVEEDDAQNGPDHVDATRTVALVAGPYVRRGVVVHDRYDQLSLLRTVELLLGLDPLTVNDALAVPMLGVLTPAANAAPFVAPAPSRFLSAPDRALLGAVGAKAASAER